MSVDLQILFGAVGAVGTIAAGYWAIGRTLVAQFTSALDQRFVVLEEARKEGRRVSEERFKRLEEKQELLDKDVRQILIELPREYVRREDYVRGQSVIEAKIDGLALRVENIMLKGGRGD